MGYMDAQTLFSDAQALTGNAASTNYLNLKAPGALGTGEGVGVELTIDVAAGGTSPALTVAVQTDDNPSFSSPTTIASSPALSAAQMTAGAKIVIPIPAGVATEQYLRLSYTLSGTTPTVTVTASAKPLSMIGSAHTYPSPITY